MNHQLNSAGLNNPLFQYVPQAGAVSYGMANADNGLTTMTASSGSATMSYDGNHNLTYDGTNTLSYDVENRMVQAENAGWGASTYLYDPLGERKQKVVGVNTATPVATDLVLAGGEEIADYYEASATWRLTVRGAGGLPLVTVVPAAGGCSEEIVYVHHDEKGSTVALTVAGSSGPADTNTYSDYGAPQSGTWLAYQYAGYRYDSETGLDYVRARSYSPALGRFLQADPSGVQGGFNLYAYAGNDPVNLEDPTGLTPDGGARTQTITAEASATLNTFFMGVLGIPTVDLAATATAMAAPNNGSYSLFQQFECAIGGTVGGAAEATGKTVGVGVGGSAGAGVGLFGGAINLGFQMLADPQGNVGFEGNLGGTILGGVVGIGAVGGVQGSISTAQNISNLSGPSVSGSVGGGDGYGAEVQGSFGLNSTASGKGFGLSGNNSLTVTGGAADGGVGAALVPAWTWVVGKTNCKGAWGW
jgi:RHS repeat-associated protein